MKKSLLAVVASLTLSNVCLTSITAQETTTETVTSVTEAIEIDYTFEESRNQFLSLLDKVPTVDLEDKVKSEIKNYLSYLSSHDLALDEETQSHLDKLLSNLETDSTQVVIEENLKATIDDYLTYTVGYVEEGENIQDTEIESIWRSFRILEKANLVDFQSDDYINMKLIVAKKEYMKLLEENYAEDGTLKDKLYSKDLKLVYAFIKKYDAGFLNETEAKYTAILQEIKNRETAQTLLNEIEEKQAKGEAVSDEVLSALEEATANIQSPTIQAQYTQSQTSSTPAPTPQAPAPQPSVTEAPVYVETPQPPVTEAPVYEETTEWSTPGQMEYAGTFATKAEADAYAVANIDWSRHRSYFTSEFPGQGVQLYFITGH